MRKSLIDWLKAANPDVLCVQETKATQEQVDCEQFVNLGYKHYWYSAEKKGYSGVAIFSKKEPNNVVYGMAHDVYDREGRVIEAQFDDVNVINAYFPSGTSGSVRQEIKMAFLADFKAHIESKLKKNENLIICGDYNISHRAIDLHNPTANKKTPGFLPEERAWFDDFLNLGLVDSFRYFNHEPHQYSWWSYRANARERNKGWRLDYIIVTNQLKNSLKSATILNRAYHSDHCPISLSLN